MSADDYDPLSLRDHHTQLTVSPSHCTLASVLHNLSLQAETGRLNDPLLTQQTDRYTEQCIISGIHDNKCGTGTHMSASRIGVAMDAVSWLAIQLMYVDSDVRQRSRYKWYLSCFAI